MSGEAQPVQVEILDKEYMVSCPPEEKDALLESVKLLNDRLKEVRDGGKVLGTERMAVMAALNVIHEFTQLQRAQVEYAAKVDGTVERLRGKIAEAIGRREEAETLD